MNCSLPLSSTPRPSQLHEFMELARERGFCGDSVSSLYSWSTTYPQIFWPLVWEFCGVIGSSPADFPFILGKTFADTSWFPKARLNIAENLLRFDDEKEALVSYREDGSRRVLTYAELRSETARVAEGLRQAGIGEGDRVAALMPNIPETVIFYLAAASIGAICSTASTDFGVAGVIERFGQIAPRVLLTVDGYIFKGKAIPLLDRVAAIVSGVPSIEHLILVPFLGDDKTDLPTNLPVTPFDSFGSIANISFAQLPFDAPLCVLFSSGTTGKPKGIIHRAGGVLLEHLKEHILHGDLRRDDTIFYQTTCGWMMWNWLVSALAIGPRIVLYEGSPLINDGLSLFEIAEREKVTIFGTNPKFLRLLESNHKKPIEIFDLSTIRTVLSTGSPLLPDQYDFIGSAISPKAQICSISGGTDIVGCFALGCPDLPVIKGELQMRSIGLAVEVWNDSGEPVVGERGELVCTAPFPTVPLGFWNDPDGTRFTAAYFTRFPGVWHHGDYVELTPEGGMIFYGRSDAVLNPGGVRIGTAEIYREVEHIPFVADCIAVGQRWNSDERIILFVVLTPGEKLTDSRREEIRSAIRKNASPFHVPRKIIAVPEIPRTRSGKLVELAVKQTINGEAVKNRESLSNPEALENFVGLPELLEE
jgi:acetoacetyl-CoA synthetase